ncbi:MAG: hypothetical protein J6T67_09405 [Paludibacteraceae bacterium]|nr:hypothetical protein [Paludibacteraceae bacterium]
MNCDELCVYKDCEDFQTFDRHFTEAYKKSEVDAAIAELKTKLEEEREFGLNRAKSADHEIGKMCVEIKELKAENRKLKRALYKACANWARSERYTEATWHGDEHREELWANVQAKCLNKAEEYK